MDQRRALIGSLIGVLVFTVLTWVSNNTWEALETQLLQGQSAISLFSQNRYSNFVVFDFDESSKFDFAEKIDTEQKDFLLSLVTEFAAQNADTVYILVDKFNSLGIVEADFEVSLGEFQTKAKTISLKDIETKVIDQEGELWLDHKQYEFEHHKIRELIEDNIPDKLISDSNILLISPQIQADPEQISLLVNFLEKNWVIYTPLSKIALCVICIISGLFLATFVYWARIIAFFFLIIVTLISGQLGYSLWNTHIEIIPIIAGLVAILILSNLFDLNLIAINRKEIFKSQVSKSSEEDFSQVAISAPFIREEKKPILISPDSSDNLRAKFFLELEDNFEDIALEFQEKTLKSVDAVQEKISELLESEEVSDKDAIKVSLLRHGFDTLIEDIDAILFNLVPFKFEGEQGLINVIELYASKIFMLSKGKIQIGIETEFPVLKFERNAKVNIYRILQRLVDLIKEANADKIARGINIGINICADANDKNLIRFRVSYEGKAIDQESPNNLKLNEIYRRVEAIRGSEFIIRERSLPQGSRQLTNNIELITPKPSNTGLKANINTVSLN